MSKEPRKPVRYVPPARPQQQQQPFPQQQSPQIRRNAFNLGGRRFNGNSTRRGSRH